MLNSQSKTIIQPFWQRIPQFFLYPLRPAALAVLIPLTIVMTILPLSLIGIPLLLITLTVFLKYLFEVLLYTSEGALEPPPVSSDLLFRDYELPFKQMGVVIALIVIGIGLFQSTGSLGVVVGYMIAVNFMFWATIMVLATTSSLITAINPLAVIGMIFRIGWPYLALVGLQLAFGSVIGLLDHLLEGKGPLALQIATASFTFLYSQVISFNLMGYVLYQYHERLGLTPAFAQDAEDADPDLELYNRFLREQNYHAALEELRGVLSRRWGELELHRAAHKLAKLIDDKETLVRHGRQYIEVLLDANRTREAMEIYKDLIAAQPAFRPDMPAQYLPIAQMLRESGQPRLAVALANGFHKRFPSSGEVPALYLLAAKIFHEDLGESAMATQILGFVAKHYPRHGLAESVRHYLQAVESFRNPA